MEVSVTRGKREYLVDTARGRITSMTGGGRPPSSESIRQIIADAKSHVAGSGITISTAPAAPRAPSRGFTTPAAVPAAPRPITLSDDELMKALAERFQMMHDLAVSATHGEFPSNIFSGSPGIGKSHTVEEVMREAARTRGIKYKIVGGANISPITLFETFYKFRNRGDVVVLDDSDSILNDEGGLMILKGALDSKEERKMTWGTRATLDDGCESEYIFRGSVIFLTNQNFNQQIDKGAAGAMSKRQQHLEAIRSRSNYLDLMLHDRRAQLLWTCHQIREQKVLLKKGLSEHEQNDVIKFMTDNRDILIECSIRSAVKMVPYILMYRRDKKNDWRRRVGIVQFKSEPLS